VVGTVAEPEAGPTTQKVFFYKPCRFRLSSGPSQKNTSASSKFKECLAASDQSPCEGQIIRAHIIPRSQLKQIAQNGHIVAVPTSLLAIMKMQRTRFEAKEIGVGEFSTMNCFCAGHDKLLFAPVEDAPLVFSREQLALLHYRAIATVRRFEDLRSLVVWFDAAPAVMAAGAFRPIYDFVAQRVQKPVDLCCYMAMHLLAANGGAVLAFTWLRRDQAAEQFARTFAALPREQMASLAVQCAFEHIEFTCMSDLWWSGLKRPVRAALLERVRRANSLSYRRSPRCLTYRIRYADWPVAHVR
jgi:hypothetical protein